MLNERALGIYFWGAYGWLVMGFCIIAIATIIEMIKIFHEKTNREG